MVNSYSEERAEKTTSLTGQEIHIYGLNISEEEWEEQSTVEEVPRQEVDKVGWTNVSEGDIVTILRVDDIPIESDKDDANRNSNETTENKLINNKPYRVVGFEMTDSDEAFSFSIVLQGPQELVLVIFSGNNSDQDSGVWGLESGEALYKEPVGCGIISDKYIATQFGYESEIVSNRI
jgi:hypothetical protein